MRTRTWLAQWKRNSSHPLWCQTWAAAWWRVAAWLSVWWVFSPCWVAPRLNLERWHRLWYQAHLCRSQHSQRLILNNHIPRLWGGAPRPVVEDRRSNTSMHTCCVSSGLLSRIPSMWAAGSWPRCSQAKMCMAGCGLCVWLGVGYVSGKIGVQLQISPKNNGYHGNALGASHITKEARN